MSIVRKLMGELLFPDSRTSEELQRSVEATLNKAKVLKTEDLQEFIRELSHLIYQREETAHAQLFVLMLVKELLLTGSFSAFLFSNVYIFPWIVSMCNFEQPKLLESRAKLLYKEVTGRSNATSFENVQSYKRVLVLSEEFLVFFGQNLKFHPCSKYKIKCSLARQLQNGSYKRSLQLFTNVDLKTLLNNLKRKSLAFREELGEFTDFVNNKIEECMENSSKFHDNLFLLLSLIDLSESYCITTAAFRLCSFFVPQKVLIVCQMADYMISTAEIQAVEAINIRCLPLMLEYLLPVNFKENSIRETPKAYLQSTTLNKLIDYFYIWHEKTKLLKLSTKIYEHSYGMIEYLKKPFKLAYQQQLKEFTINLEKMQQNNEVKRTFIIDQHQEEEQKIISLLKQASFCISSQKVQRQIAYENVLDDLTITEKESICDFSESLLKSAQLREGGVTTETEKSTSRVKLKNSSKLLSSKRSQQNQQAKAEKQEIQNIYYNKNSIPNSRPNPKAINAENYTLNKISFGQLQPSENRKRDNHSKLYHQQCESSAEVQYPSFPKLTSRDSRGRPNPRSSSKSQLSIHSSQFSQKDNNDRLPNNKAIDSVYLSRSNNHEHSKDKSGEFLYFQKESQLKSQKTQQMEMESLANEKEQIEFNDSLKMINQSQSCQLLEFGMDIHAKVPQTVSKPKFNFKNMDTDDSSIILKDLNLTPQKQTVTALTPKSKRYHKEVDSPIAAYQLKDSREGQISGLKSLGSNIPSPRAIPKQPVIVSNNQSQTSSIIQENSAQPHLISQSISFSNEKPPSKFGEVFKQKSEKASVLSSSRSLKRLKHLPQRQIQIPDFKKLRDLQNQLGKLKKETEQYNQELQQKTNQMKRLQKQKIEIAESDPYYLKKQNEIMKILLKNKSKDPKTLNFHSSAKHLAKQLKQSSIKNYNMSLKEYNPEILKLKFSNIAAYSKEQKKNIISNRCILLKNDLVEIGYSFKNNCVTLYLTLKNYCDSLEINLVENSVIFSESIRRSFDKLYVGKQMKFKTEVNQTKENSQFIPSTVNVKLTYHHKLDLKNEEFTCELPLTPYNMAQPLTSAQGNSVLSQYITPLYNSSEDLLKKGKPYLLSLFPHGLFNEDSSVFTINYKWKERVETISLKLKERSFRVEGAGSPLETGRQLIETIISLLIDGP